jgi:hypothetical protein
MSDFLKGDFLTGMNLPRVGAPLESQGDNDYEKVGFGHFDRTAGDALKTAVNNGIAVVEDLGKAIATPFVGIAVGFGAAVKGEGMAIGPSISNTQRLGVGGRVAYAIGGPIAGIVGAAAYGLQALADAGQAALALGDAALKLITGKV